MLRNNKLLEKIILGLVFLVFASLVFKDVFSTRTLIPNLEPYPDSIHYINSSFSFLKGHGFIIEREGRFVPPTVPPLYSIVLTPLFLIKPDARMFYFTNLILSFASLFLMYKILKKITDNILIVGFLLFLYVTNYFIYWYPTIPMAENLTLTLFLGAVYLISGTISNLNLSLAAILTVALYFTKYASLPLTLSFAAAFFIKIFLDGRSRDLTIKNSLKFFLFLITAFLPFYFYDLFIRKTDTVTTVLKHIPGLFNIESPTSSSEKVLNPYFSTNYFSENLKTYSGSLIGKPMRFLWDNTPMVTSWMGFMGLIGLLAGLFEKRLRVMAISLILSLVSAIVFLSNFYVADGRYFYHAIPAIIIGMAILLSRLELKINNFKVLTLILIVLFAFYSFSNFQRLKYQVSLNLRHAETPWYYVSVVNLNDYFKEEKPDDKPVVISALPPYYVDFFSNKNYTLLPLSKNQEFPSIREQVWGPNDYSNLINLYKKYLMEGKELYVNNYGLGNEQPLHDDYDLIKKEFTLQKVKDGCDGACDTFRVNLK